MQRSGGRAGPCRHPLAGRPLRALPAARTTPLAQPRTRHRERRWGRRGSAGPHVRALPGGGVPGRARAAARGGRGVPRTPSLLLLLRRGRRCLFLPPAPSPPRPGRGAPRAELDRAGRSGRRAPQAAAAAATVVAAARAGKLCPFVRSAPEAAGRSVQSVPFRLRSGGGAAGGVGGPAWGEGRAWGAGRGGRHFVAEGAAGHSVTEPGGGGGRGGGCGAAGAERPRPQNKGARAAARARPGPSRSAPPPRAPSAERAALPRLACGRGARRGSRRWLPWARPHSRPLPCRGRPGSPAG